MLVSRTAGPAYSVAGASHKAATPPSLRTLKLTLSLGLRVSAHSRRKTRKRGGSASPTCLKKY